MYSILLKVATSSSIKWKFLTDSEGVIYVENDLENVQAKVVELLDSYLLSDIKVIKNCTITSSITIEEVEE